MADHTDIVTIPFPIVEGFYLHVSGGGIDPPIVDAVSPVPGSEVSPGTPIVIDITDDSQVEITVLIVKMGRFWEVAYDGEKFAPLYADYSTKTTIIDGNRYSLKRIGGWTATVQINVLAIDDGGNIAI